MKRNESDVRESFSKGRATQTRKLGTKATGVKCEICYWPDEGLAARVQATLENRRKMRLPGLATCARCDARIRGVTP